MLYFISGEIRSFNLFSTVANTNLKTELKYEKKTYRLSLTTNMGTKTIILLSSFNGKRIVVLLTENANANITKAILSNYSSTLVQASSPVRNQRVNFGFTAEDGVLHKILYSKNFYDLDSEEYHRILIQEKLSGRYLE